MVDNSTIPIVKKKKKKDIQNQRLLVFKWEFWCLSSYCMMSSPQKIKKLKALKQNWMEWFIISLYLLTYYNSSVSLTYIYAPMSPNLYLQICCAASNCFWIWVVNKATNLQTIWYSLQQELFRSCKIHSNVELTINIMKLIGEKIN